MKPSFQSLAALSGCVLVATRAAGLASTITVYADTACTEMAGTTVSTFGAYDISTDGTFSLGLFNTCLGGEAYGGSSLMTVCDAETGKSGIISYSDAECTMVLSDYAALPSCIVTPNTTFAAETACTDAEPSAISPNAFNIVVDEYNDADCTDPTGNQLVVSGDLLDLESTSGTCYQGATNYGHSQCLADGTLISQVFGGDDSTCTGDVYLEIVSNLPSIDYCGILLENGLYYNGLLCTTDPATVGEGATILTPAPTSIVYSSNTPAPTAMMSSGETPVPTSTVESGDGDVGTSNTPAPAAILDGTETPAPISTVETGDGDVSSSNSPAPAASLDGDKSSTAPNVTSEDEDGSVEIVTTSAPSVVGDGSGFDTSGALGAGTGAGAPTAAVACALLIAGATVWSAEL